jgi:hypothetical protein
MKLIIERDEYFRDMLKGLEVGKSVCIPTSWGYYGIKLLDADGAIEVYVSTIRGHARTMHLVPRVSNVVDIIPAIV